MGVTLPIYFMPVEEADLVGVDFDDWNSAVELIMSREHSPETSGLRSSASRNWWHLENARRYARQNNSDALEFLDSEIACLDSHDIVAAIHVLTDILADASHGIIDEMATSTTPEANVDLIEAEGEAIGDARKGAFVRAYARATPKFQNNSSDAGYSGIIDFFTFLKSLFAGLADALLQGKRFLFVRPH